MASALGGTVRLRGTQQPVTSSLAEGRHRRAPGRLTASCEPEGRRFGSFRTRHHSQTLSGAFGSAVVACPRGSAAHRPFPAPGEDRAGVSGCVGLQHRRATGMRRARSAVIPRPIRRPELLREQAVATSVPVPADANGWDAARWIGARCMSGVQLSWIESRLAEFLTAYRGQSGGTLMRMRYLLPLVGLLALTACKDEKKAENPAPPPASTSTAPANPAPSTTTTNPPAANKPANQ